MYPHFEVSLVLNFHFFEAEILINFDQEIVSFLTSRDQLVVI